MPNSDPDLQDHANDIFRALTLCMGRGREFSVDDVEMGTGIKGRTLNSYIAADPDARKVPSGDKLLRLMSFFGTPFTTKLIARGGMGAFNLVPQPGDPEEIIATLMDTTHEFTRRGLDRVYCNNDQGALEPVADKAIAILTPFSSKARR